MEVVMIGAEEAAMKAHLYGNPVRRAVLGLIFAASVIALGILGPSLAGQSVPALTELRYDVLMFDREFERYSIRTRTPVAETVAMAEEDFNHGAGARPKGSRRGG